MTRLVDRISRAAFALACIVLTVLLLLPGQDLPDTGIWDKLEHAGAFAALTLLGALALRGRRLVALVGAIVLYGVVCELLQIFVPGRESSARDALANAIGVISAALVAWLVRWALSRVRRDGQRRLSSANAAAQP